MGQIRAIERPGRAGIDSKDLEVVERAGAHAADRAGAAGELQRAVAADNPADEHGAGVDHEPIGAAPREVDGKGPAGNRAGVGHRAGTAGEEDAKGAAREGPASEVRDAAAALEIDAGAGCRADVAGIAERRGTSLRKDASDLAGDRGGGGVHDAAAGLQTDTVRTGNTATVAHRRERNLWSRRRT